MGIDITYVMDWCKSYIVPETHIESEIEIEMEMEDLQKHCYKNRCLLR